MNKVVKIKTIPENSNVTHGFGIIDYYDSYQIKCRTDKNAENISKDLMTMPDWVIFLFGLRNSMVKIFGLKTGKIIPQSESIFNLIEKNDDEIIMGESDKHLNFRASILRDKSKNTLSLITVVQFNNIWGRIYFFPVKPFHKIIIKTLLKRYQKNASK